MDVSDLLQDELGNIRSQRIRSHERFLQMQTEITTAQIQQHYIEINAQHDVFIQQTIELAQRQLARDGWMSPPVPYVYILFGSAGRIEQTLSSDQDSGILYDDTGCDEQQKEQARHYYLLLATRVVDNLQQLGYPPCEGGVISTNAQWNQPLASWLQFVTAAVQDPTFESCRQLLILADGRPIAGDERLFGRLQGHYYNLVSKTPSVHAALLSNTMRYKVLIGLFGQLLREPYGEETGSLDIKYGAYIPFVNAIRYLAIVNDIRECSTIKRLVRLIEQRVLSASLGEEAMIAFEHYLYWRLMTQERISNGLYSNNGKLPKQLLHDSFIRTIKQSLRVGKKLQAFVEKWKR